MAQFVAPQPADSSIPTFFNVDQVVGASPAQNLREDVLLVQFAFSVVAKNPKSALADLLEAAKAVQVTGNMDEATINAIRVLQQDRKKENPGTVVDGRVSPAKLGYSYGSGIWTIVYINVLLRNRTIAQWPRLDKVAGCPGDLQQMVTRAVVGKA